MRHKCLAVFLVFLLYFTITGVIVFAELKMITKADFLKKTVAQSDIFQNLPKMAHTLAATNKSTDLKSKVLLEYYAQSLPANYLQTEFDKNIKPFVDYLTGQAPKPNVTINLQPLKQSLKLNPDKLEAIVSAEVEKLPVCTAEEEQELQNQNTQNTENPSSEEKPLGVSCRPGEISAKSMTAEIMKEVQLDSLIDSFPDNYNLATNLKNPDQTFRSAKLAFKIINWGFWFNLILTLILMGFLVLLGRSWWPSILRWIGWSLVLPSGLILLMNLSWNFLQTTVQNQLASGFDPQIYQSFSPLFETINQNTLAASLLISGIIFGLGLILIILSYALPHPPEPKPAPKSPPPPQPAKV
mgnify:CR=1 FL=1